MPAPARLVPLLVAAALFMENLDGTVISTALPAIASTFGVPSSTAGLGMSAYLLTLAVFIPASGWAADRFGTRDVFVAAIAVFTVASLGCALSDDLAMFVTCRVVQGFGGALMTPVGRLAVIRSAPKADLMRVIALITWPALVAPVVAPPLGGLITTYASWRWVFLLNLPLGAVGGVLAWRLIANDRANAPPRLDAAGLLLSGIGLFGVMAGVEALGQPKPLLAAGSACIGVGATALWATVRHARRSPQPILQLSALRLPSFSVSVVAGSLTRTAIGVAPFLVPLLFQVGFGMSAFRSGLLFFALTAGNLGMKTFVTPILRRFGFRRVLIVNTVGVALSACACALLSPATPLPFILLVMLACGLTRSMQFTCLNTLAFADVPKSEMAGANTLFSTAQQLSMGLGVAFGALALNGAAWLREGSLASDSGVGHPVGDFRVAFVLVALLALTSLPAYVRLPRDAGATLGTRT
ncbi:MFS transporter [Chitinasiproducens palmae]|nr:MFS transporter [Chitinasiproducens palmae]